MEPSRPVVIYLQHSASQLIGFMFFLIYEIGTEVVGGKMVRTKYRYLLSVDSETGVYWYGNRELHDLTQINVSITQSVGEHSGRVNSYAGRGVSLIQFVALYLIRRVREWTRIRTCGCL
jgi:hypothetical protein